MGQVLWEQTKPPYYNRFQHCPMMSLHHSTNSQHLSRPARVSSAHTGGEWAGGGKGEIEDHQELQSVLLPALCTSHTQCGTQRPEKKERKNVHVCHQIENENVFTTPKTAYSSITQQAESLYKQSSYLGKRKFLLLNSISKSTLCPTPRDHVASSVRDNSNSSHKSAKAFVILKEWPNQILDNPTPPKPIARYPGTPRIIC